jgi:poly(3-hydroxybutyrate) depolymerase
MKRGVAWILAGCALVFAQIALFDAPVLGQARQPLALMRVLYNTQKATVKPQGPLKDKIDALDREIAEAQRIGRTGTVRGLLTKGIALLAGREWTNELEFSTSLVVRAEQICVDSSAPYAIRLEQIYVPRVEFTSLPAARVSLHKIGRGPLANRPGDLVKELASENGIPRDLMDEPARFETDLSGIPDGPYLMRVELFEKEKSVGSASLRIELLRGLNQRLSGLTRGLDTVGGFEALRSEVLYPADQVRNINRGRIALGTFDLAKEVANAEAVLASLRSGKDPFAGRTGDMKRHYLLESAGEILPYRIYVPQNYKGDKVFPLVIALHGLGGTEDSLFSGYEQQLPKMAEQHGYLVAAPLGYRVDGGYGAARLRAAGDPAAERRSEHSEADAMRVLDLMKKNYKVDENRIYLMGHSMGAIGTWYLGAKYPDIWAALAPFSGTAAPATVEKMKNIPQFVVHGNADMTVPAAGSRIMVEMMKKLGAEHQYIEVPGGDHSNVVAPNIPAMFDFFDKHGKSGPSGR